MNMIVFGFLAATAVTATPAAGLPPGEVYAVRPIDGYKCMKLDLTEKQAMDFSGASQVWILTAPEAHAPRGVGAGSVVLVKTPEHLVNGYLEVLQNSGKPGWIQADRVKPYNPNARCVPSLLSNGLYSGG
jgi:hypothetical protein